MTAFQNNPLCPSKGSPSMTIVVLNVFVCVRVCARVCARVVTCAYERVCVYICACVSECVWTAVI